MKAEASEMPGSIVAYAVSWRLRRVNFAALLLPVYKAGTEAFRASGGLNASRIQVMLKPRAQKPEQKRKAGVSLGG